MSTQNDPRSLPELFSSLVTQMSTLFRQEVRLARAETSENIVRMTAGLGILAAAAVLLVPGLVVLLQAIAGMLVAQGMQPQWALLIVGLVVIVVGAILLLIGLGRLKASTLTPDRTIEQVRRDATIVKEQVR